MQDHRKMSRLALATMIAAAVAAPTATATGMPIDSTRYDAKAYVPTSAKMDMHASTVAAPAAQKLDLRTENAIAPSRAAAMHPRGVMPDLRGEFAAYPSPAAPASPSDLRGEFAADPSPAPAPPAGLPTWPVDPKPIVPVTAQPVAGDGDGIDIEWPIGVLILTGALALGGGLAFAGQRLRTQAAH